GAADAGLLWDECLRRDMVPRELSGGTREPAAANGPIGAFRRDDPHRRDKLGVRGIGPVESLRHSLLRSHLLPSGGPSRELHLLRRPCEEQEVAGYPLSAQPEQLAGGGAGSGSLKPRASWAVRLRGSERRQAVYGAVRPRCPRVPGPRLPGLSVSAMTSSFYVSGGTLGPDAPSYVERGADRDLYEGLLGGE